MCDQPRSEIPEIAQAKGTLNPGSDGLSGTWCSWEIWPCHTSGSPLKQWDEGCQHTCVPKLSKKTEQDRETSSIFLYLFHLFLSFCLRDDSTWQFMVQKCPEPDSWSILDRCSLKLRWLWTNAPMLQWPVVETYAMWTPVLRTRRKTCWSAVLTIADPLDPCVPSTFCGIWWLPTFPTAFSEDRRGGSIYE